MTTPLPLQADARMVSLTRRAVVAAVFGTTIEWFDYALYGAAAGLIINKLFFPNLSSTAGMLAAFVTFALGFFSRPLGGIVISHLGDRYGRKPALVATILLMGVSTFAIGLLPTYAEIGMLAPVLLTVLRLMQGLGAGAEYAGALTLVAEYVPAHKKAYYTAYLQAATFAGIMLATLAFLLVSVLPEDILLGWAWRVPFLLSALLIGVALYIRKNLDETPEYVAATRSAMDSHRAAAVPISELLRHRPRELVFGFLSLTGHNANAYILSTFSLGYLTNTLGMAPADALTAVMVATLTGVVVTPPLGALADTIGHATLYLCGALFTLVFAVPMFLLLETRSLALVTLGLSIGYGFGYGGLAAAQGAFLASLFPVNYRFSGIALAREFNSVLIAGPTPFIATALVSAGGGDPVWVACYLMACCAISAVAIVIIRGSAGKHGAA